MLETEVWSQFDQLAYVFVDDSQRQISKRVAAMRTDGAESWDYVRPLSRDELERWESVAS